MNHHDSPGRFVPCLGLASRRGIRPHNMDAVAAFDSIYHHRAIAVVDGIGNDGGGALTMQLLAETAVRIGVTRGALAGVLAAAALIEDPGTEDYAPDGVIALAVAKPGKGTELAWVGDSHIYGWDGTNLHRRSDPHTMGMYLRQNGETDAVAVPHDNWIRVSLSTASPTTVAVSEAPPDELVILVSDGLDDIPGAVLERLVIEHQHYPQTLANALVKAVQASADGYRDDATAAVLRPWPPTAA